MAGRRFPRCHWQGPGLVMIALVTIFVATSASAQIKKGRRFSGGGDCEKCHQMEALDEKNQHEPFKDNKCTECHKPHGMVGVLRLKENGTALCALCHAEQELGLTGAQI